MLLPLLNPFILMWRENQRIKILDERVRVNLPWQRNFYTSTSTSAQCYYMLHISLFIVSNFCSNSTCYQSIRSRTIITCLLLNPNLLLCCPNRNICPDKKRTDSVFYPSCHHICMLKAEPKPFPGSKNVDLSCIPCDWLHFPAFLRTPVPQSY